ncbi:P-loop containing nucleoside triphosphate hydrolase protein [Gamsiella multidivaricata]|uniref:P-loop containing nucleoside triphosphate hydrolase protein n=1 Tax=Gamsiella multidivaricata TaxID=101098 RepID=UPI00222072D0|nr:P-loop containing nucleoside triphosphate hydrolase protein [Gamsiella multidivaricata]KAG0370992.1 ATP-dependent DNA/RNA helicase [Gamsiella multidivaricata]KAI7817681.1 P-loop containing nucleoside triphosphate hydrolase protein [Gamsiella multidivaricata]
MSDADTTEFSAESADANVTFADLGLDDRLLRGLAKLNFTKPTPVQAKSIPLALAGKDILAKARTGSGKTAAFMLPLIHKILAVKDALPANSPEATATRGLVLVPTVELAGQVTTFTNNILLFCGRAVNVLNIAGKQNDKVQQPLLATLPDIIVSTPSRILAQLKMNAVDLKTHFQTLVIDEADLVCNYDYEEDVKELLTFLPKIYQSFLMSATLGDDVDSLKQLVLRSPAILKMEDKTMDSTWDNLKQLYTICTDTDKYLILYVLLKLKLLKGKCIIFVNDIERCYRLKLFLEQFSIPSVVLNSELPLNSRVHIVEEFNKGKYDYMIATDEGGLKGEKEEEATIKEIEDGKQEERESDAADEEEHENESEDDEQDDEADDIPEGDIEMEFEGSEGEDISEGEDELEAMMKASDNEDEDDEASAMAEMKSEVPASESKKRKQPEDDSRSETTAETSAKSKKKTGPKKDQEYGVSRGIDFVNVAAVVNFDFPPTAKSYTHRVGRTARGGQMGTSLSFVVTAAEKERSIKTSQILGGGGWTVQGDDEAVFNRVVKQQVAAGCTINPYTIPMQQLAGFRYRMDDAMRAVTKSAIREARLKELKAEMLNSEKLRAHFEDKPKDLEFLRHDKTLHPTKVQPHMKHVPDYMMPKVQAVSSQKVGEAAEGLGYVTYKKKTQNTVRKARQGKGGNKSSGGKKNDPLKKFSFGGGGNKGKGGKRQKTA